MKLMIVGIDALDPRMLFDNIDMFPNIKKICEEGCASSYDAYAYGYGSYDNWISLYTGLTPNQHGVKGNINTNTNKTPEYSDYINKRPFWKVLNDNDLKIGMWRGLATSPAEKIDGYMVSGEANFEFDGSIQDYESMKPMFHEDDRHIENQLTGDDLGYPLRPRSPSDYGFTWEEIFKDHSIVEKILKDHNYYEDGYIYLEKELDYYKENIINIQKNHPTDVLFYYTPTLDLIQHFQSYDPDRRVILESMQLVDNFIGSLNNELKPENIIILSDHGSSSFKEVLPSDDISTQKEAFGWRNKSIWLRNGEIVTKARNEGILNAFHDIKGTLIISGQDIKKCKIEDVRTIDFYPTVLELLGIKVPGGRAGYVLDIFKKQVLVNKDKLLKDNNTKYKKIVLVQNMGVPEFNTIINEVFLDYRFHEITLLCEEKYMSIFEINARVKKVLDGSKYTVDKSFLSEYDYLFFGYKNEATQEVKYMKLNLA